MIDLNNAQREFKILLTCQNRRKASVTGVFILKCQKIKHKETRRKQEIKQELMK